MTVSFSSSYPESDASATPREKVRGFNLQRETSVVAPVQIDVRVNVAEDGHESETIPSEVTVLLCSGVQRFRNGRSSAFNDVI